MKLNKNTIEFFLNEVSTERINNYIIPGLSSSMIGSKHEGGACVRLFDASRRQHTEITPHSHRFDFQCLVLRGSVINRTWTVATDEQEGDLFQLRQMTYAGEVGTYADADDYGEPSVWSFEDKAYMQGDWYSMDAEEIHSIVFSNDAVVLFFEGHEVSDRSLYLQPVVDGKVVPTFKVEPWMFQKAPA